MTTAPTVPFVCLHGSAKSLIALEHFRRLAAQRGFVPAVSEGCTPARDVIVGRLSGLLDPFGRTA